jgi:hypothetical protein
LNVNAYTVGPANVFGNEAPWPIANDSSYKSMYSAAINSYWQRGNCASPCSGMKGSPNGYVVFLTNTVQSPHTFSTFPNTIASINTAWPVLPNPDYAFKVTCNYKSAISSISAWKYQHHPNNYDVTNPYGTQGTLVNVWTCNNKVPLIQTYGAFNAANSGLGAAVLGLQ